MKINEQELINMSDEELDLLTAKIAEVRRSKKAIRMKEISKEIQNLIEEAKLMGMNLVKKGYINSSYEFLKVSIDNKDLIFDFQGWKGE